MTEPSLFDATDEPEPAPPPCEFVLWYMPDEDRTRCWRLVHAGTEQSCVNAIGCGGRKPK